MRIIIELIAIRKYYKHDLFLSFSITLYTKGLFCYFIGHQRSTSDPLQDEALTPRKKIGWLDPEEVGVHIFTALYEFYSSCKPHKDIHEYKLGYQRGAKS